MCGEQFEQFWDEEEDEWHLRDAVRIAGKVSGWVMVTDIVTNDVQFILVAIKVCSVY